MNKPYTFVFFGIVGSGKGTQVDLLKKYLKDKDPSTEIVSVYPGSEFRKMIESGSYTGNLVKATLEQGQLQPNFLTISVFTNKLVSSLEPTSHLIVDGFPRTVTQSEILEVSMDFYKREDIKIIYISVEKEEAIRRMKLRGRTDDTDEGITKRIDEYVNNVIPAMYYFKDKGNYTIYTVNGEQEPEAVHKELIASLGI
ncbi:MAG: nucleoside monophosphate kinase [Patescibacteria group bacterium]|nr:nucleoside monophosphate kinase [Patescibacteria group bacterium]